MENSQPAKKYDVTLSFGGKITVKGDMITYVEGVLDISDDEGTSVALFAPGLWNFVVEREVVEGSE